MQTDRRGVQGETGRGAQIAEDRTCDRGIDGSPLTRSKLPGLKDTFVVHYFRTEGEEALGRGYCYRSARARGEAAGSRQAEGCVNRLL